MSVKDFFVDDIRKIADILKNKKKILKKFEEEKNRNKDWFFSSQAEEAYKGLATPGEKAEFFYQYFRCLVNDRINEIKEYSDISEARESLSALARIMPGIENLGEEYSSYPNILDENKNPFVKYILTNDKALSINAKPKHCDDREYIKQCEDVCFNLLNVFSKSPVSKEEMYKIFETDDENLKALQYDIIFLFYITPIKQKIYMDEEKIPNFMLTVFECFRKEQIENIEAWDAGLMTFEIESEDFEEDDEEWI